MRFAAPVGRILLATITLSIGLMALACSGDVGRAPTPEVVATNSSGVPPLDNAPVSGASLSTLTGFGATDATWASLHKVSTTNFPSGCTTLCRNRFYDQQSGGV